MKFKVPRVFYIKGKRWVTKFVKADELVTDAGYQAHAIAYVDERYIEFDKELKHDPVLLEKIVLHELFHAAFYEGHLDKVDTLNAETEEILCDVFADLVTATLKKYFYKR